MSSPDTPVTESADAAATDPLTRPDAPIDAPVDTSTPDAAVSGDRATIDAAKDLNAPDAPATDGGAKDAGPTPDSGRPDTVDAMAPDTARTPDSALPDSGPLPDAGAIYTVTFKSGVGKGAMSGYGWVTMGALDIVSSPTCGPNNEAITNAVSCPATSTNWDSSSALCVSGTVPALPASPTATDYSDNWGIQLGVNASDPIGALGKTYTTITLNFTGLPQNGLRATLHRTGDPIGTTYCSLVTSGTAMVLTSFNTSCWNGSGTSLTSEDLPKIDKVGLEVPSGSTEIAISKLCLTSIVFGS